VALGEVKAFLRIAHDGEDELLGALIRSAGEMCERFTGRALLPRDILETLPASSAWTRLGAGPVRAIAGVEALPADAYAVDIDAAGDGWVRVTRADGAKVVRVSYSAGMAAEAEGLPEALRHGIVRLAAHLYAERGEGAAPPAAVTALWRPWRRLRLR
jgi:uncharacterized phiE125 gp8 family phage protein